MQKKYIVLLLLLFPVCLCNCQSIIDTVSYRFVYDVQAKVFERSAKSSPDLHYLDIGKTGVSHYYSSWQRRRFEILDSLSRIGGSMQDYDRVRHEQGVEPSYFSYYVYKNYPQKGIQTIDYVSMEIFQYQEPMGQDWELVEGDTIILEHPCQKAVCHYHGKTWTAFYAMDIPISEGPWKLCGLPGLILRAYDSDGAFFFNCIGIRKDVKEQITMMNEKRMVMKPEQVHKLIELIDTNPDQYNASRGHYSKSTIIDKNGKERPFILPKRAYYEFYSKE